MEVCSEDKCGGCVDCQLSQALQQLENVSRQLDSVQHVQRAAEDFAQNVTNQLVEGSGEMTVKTDRSFRELVKSLNRDRKCESCGHGCDLSDSQMILGNIVCNECTRFGRFAHTMQDLQMGRDWRKDSSLEKWFPLTALRLAELESKIECVVKLLAQLSESPSEAIQAINKALGR